MLILFSLLHTRLSPVVREITVIIFIAIEADIAVVVAVHSTALVALLICLLDGSIVVVLLVSSYIRLQELMHLALLISGQLILSKKFFFLVFVILVELSPFSLPLEQPLLKHPPLPCIPYRQLAVLPSCLNFRTQQHLHDLEDELRYVVLSCLLARLDFCVLVKLLIVCYHNSNEHVPHHKGEQQHKRNIEEDSKRRVPFNKVIIIGIQGDHSEKT